ncbi:MAG: hypothetical protein C4347_01745 [Patescibacteria group bacterium]
MRAKILVIILFLLFLLITGYGVHSYPNFLNAALIRIPFSLKLKSSNHEQISTLSLNKKLLNEENKTLDTQKENEKFYYVEYRAPRQTIEKTIIEETTTKVVIQKTEITNDQKSIQQQEDKQQEDKDNQLNQDIDSDQDDDQQNNISSSRDTSGKITTSKDRCDDYKNKNYPKIIINEIQFETASDTKDEFIELYNPNNEEIDLTCWKLEKYSSKQNPTSTPTLITLIPQSKFQGKIKPNGFFLITSSSTKEKYQADLAYAESYSISKNNTIILRKPNGEISDLVGYGDNKEKIYQYEGKPFIFKDLKNKSIQRKNFQDTDNNSSDFWLRNPSPQNSSSSSQLPRNDFIDLTKLEIKNFTASTKNEDGTINLNISFQEPLINITSTNYSYELIFSTSTEFFVFKLEDFGTTSTLPLPKFDNSTTILTFTLLKCPTTLTKYYLAFYLKDNLDNENKSRYSTSTIDLPQEFCKPENIPTQTSTTKILISEIMIEGPNKKDEYIELYNPNNYDVELTGWSLKKITSQRSYLLFTFPTTTIYSFSYLLLANSSSTLNFSTQPDYTWQSSKILSLTTDSALILVDKNNNIVDYVCWGNFNNSDFPNINNCAPNPPPNKVLLRKAGIDSTEETMKNEEKNFGNSFDTDNSFNDFLITDPEPQNSQSEKERPPITFTNEKILINTSTNILTLEFNFPYQLIENSYYKISLNSTTSFFKYPIATNQFLW